jgi:hypothetical protein
MLVFVSQSIKSWIQYQGGSISQCVERSLRLFPVQLENFADFVQQYVVSLSVDINELTGGEHAEH